MLTQAKGTIRGHGNTEIVFQFKPSIVTSAKAIFALLTSQFDFEPYLFHVLGNADPNSVDVQELYEEQERIMKE